MPVSSSFRSYVLDQLGSLEIHSRSMFGGVGLYWGSAFFAILDDDVLYLKVDDTSRSAYLELGARPFDPLGNGTPMNGYYEVPAEILEDRELLARWRAEAVRVAEAAKQTKSGAASKRPPGRNPKTRKR